MADSDPIPLDGSAELTEAERLALRKVLRDNERASWALRKLRILIPMAVAIVVAVYHGVDWLVKHVRFS